ncbi:hypothetical protein, partial [Serratia marcescens]|uniref:hypothetical protein n=1 Tax=Serratia marcescens TaxID=615 RepID=UPI0013DB0FAE
SLRSSIALAMGSVLALISPKLASIAILAVYEMENVRNLVAGVASFVAWRRPDPAGQQEAARVSD